MFKKSRKAEPRRGPFRRLSDSETLLFIAQTLQPRAAEQDTPDIATKLEALQDILAHQEIDLLNWPDSPSKDRFYAAHLKAKRLVSEIAESFSGAANDAAAANGIGKSHDE
jgi:hypothetical protein